MQIPIDDDEDDREEEYIYCSPPSVDRTKKLMAWYRSIAASVSAYVQKSSLVNLQLKPFFKRVFYFSNFIYLTQLTILLLLKHLICVISLHDSNDPLTLFFVSIETQVLFRQSTVSFCKLHHHHWITDVACYGSCRFFVWEQVEFCCHSIYLWKSSQICIL